MAAPDPTTELLQGVVQTLTKSLSATQADNQALRSEVLRLVKMVEGLTRQLDELLADKR